MENDKQKTAPVESTQAAPAESAPAKPVKEKLTWAERRRRWQAAKAEKRRQEREYYRYAPWPIKAWHYWLRTTLIVLALAGVFFALFGQQMLGSMLSDYIQELRTKPLTDKQREEI